MQTASADVATTTAVTNLTLRVAKELADLLLNEDLDTAASAVEIGVRHLAPAIALELRTRSRRVGVDSSLCGALAFLIERWGERVHDAKIARALDLWGENNCATCAVSGFNGHRCGDCLDAAEVLS